MTYAKPEFVVLMHAVNAIQGSTLKHQGVMDSKQHPFVETMPAYEADE